MTKNRPKVRVVKKQPKNSHQVFPNTKRQGNLHQNLTENTSRTSENFCINTFQSENSTRSSHLKPQYKIPDQPFSHYPKVINVSYIGDLALRTWSPKASCGSITCTSAPGNIATFCFQKTTPEYYFQSGEHKNKEGISCESFENTLLNPY